MGITDLTPYGALRKVESVQMHQHNQFQVHTTQATLEDVIVEGSISFSSSLTQCRIAAFIPMVDGVDIQLDCVEALSLDGLIINFNEAFSRTLLNTIRIDGSVLVNSNFDVNASFGRWLGLEELHFLNETTVIKELNVRAGARIPNALEEIRIGRLIFMPITVPPGIIVTPILNLYVGVVGNIGEVSAGIESEKVLTIGFSYQDRNFYPMGELQREFRYNMPQANLRCQVMGYIKPQVEFNISGIAGLFANIQGYLDIEVEPYATPWWELHAGVGSTVGVNAGIFSRLLPAWESRDLIGYRVLLASAATTYPDDPDERDEPDEPDDGVGLLAGNVFDAFTGLGLNNAAVEVSRAGNVIGAGMTGLNGDYSLSLPAGRGYTVRFDKTGYLPEEHGNIIIQGGQSTSLDSALVPAVGADEIRIVLTWDFPPNDLDSHLTGPIAGSTDRFHVFYGRRGSEESTPYARLDLDNTRRQSDDRPETITIYREFDGIYRYSVHNFSNRSATNCTNLSNSNARVRVYRGNVLLRTFNVPAREGTLWTVFELSGNTIIPINDMSYESTPSSIQIMPHAETDAWLISNLPSKH